MRATDWKRLSRPVLAGTNASWAWSKAFAYIQPVDWVVHGLLVEDSGNRPGEFYLWVVRLPLMVPADGVIDLSWSDRFGGGSAAYGSSSSAIADAISGAAVSAIANKRQDRWLLDPPGGADNVRMQEARAYGLLLSGDEESALEVLRRVGRYEAHYPWEKELLDRAIAAKVSIESGQSAGVIEQLRLWRLENCDSLGLACD